MPALNEPVRYLKGVGPEMARRLERLGLLTIRDLLYHLPSGYRDRREVTPIARLETGAEATIAASVASVETRRRRGGKSDLVASLRDESGFLRAVWFNAPYVGGRLRLGERYLFSGTVQRYRGPEFHNPEFESEEEGERLHVSRLAPRYPLTEGVSERWVRARVHDALEGLPPVSDPVPEARRAALRVPSLDRALRDIHFPERPADVEPARRRLALEELLRLQISLQFARRRHRDRVRAPSLAAGADAMRAFAKSLPFRLTGAQIRALAAIAVDLDAVVPMRRLLLGDVGSGKTVVALAAAVRAAAAGRPHFGASVARDAVGGHGGGEPRAALTPRERDVLRLIARGLSSKEIADDLGLRTRTVEAYRVVVMDKVGVRHIAGLTKYALRHHLTTLDDD
jgi:ATP-dependent DNA helicase RecG